jgi:hypothetical protein
LSNEPFNGENKCVCSSTADDSNHLKGSDGSHILTGEKGKYFTLVEVEVFKVVL